MARKPRIHYPGAFYHVMLRGNGGADIFFDDNDRYRFQLLLQQCTERYGCRIHAYCLMTNHVHLAVQVGTIPLSRIMQNLSFRYTRWVNWRRQKIGHLFQGRYKAIVIDLDNYLLQLTAYLHLNPVRVGVTINPEDYLWSSHRVYMGQETIPWLYVDQVLSQLSPRTNKSRQLFAEFVNNQREGEYRKEFHGKAGIDSRVFGEDTFVEQALQQAEQEPFYRPDLNFVLQVVKEKFNVSDDELRKAGQGLKISETRAMLAWAVLEHSAATLRELSRWIGKDESSLSSSVRRLREKAKKSSRITTEMNQVKNSLIKFACLQA